MTPPNLAALIRNSRSPARVADHGAADPQSAIVFIISCWTAIQCAPVAFCSACRRTRRTKARDSARERRNAARQGPSPPGESMICAASVSSRGRRSRPPFRVDGIEIGDSGSHSLRARDRAVGSAADLDQLAAWTEKAPNPIRGVSPEPGLHHRSHVVSSTPRNNSRTALEFRISEQVKRCNFSLCVLSKGHQ